jgi:RNA polymerase sigma factor (sigma-70 family)
MTTYTKEDYLTVNFMIEKLLVTHFSEWVKPQDRNEVRQEILDKILNKKIQHSDSKGNLGKWLYRLIKNHLTDSFRKNRRSIIQPIEDLSYLSIPEDESELLKEELFIDRWTQYNELLSREHPLDEQIVRLRHEKGLKYKQIASELSIPEGPLAMRYKRIRARLKENYRQIRLEE